MAINIGHQGQPCKTATGAMRILGFFEYADDIPKKYDNNTELNVYTVPVGSWFAITKEPTEAGKEKELQDKVVSRVNSYIQEKIDECKTIVEQSQNSKEKERYDASVNSLNRMQAVDSFMEKKLHKFFN